MSGGGVWLLMDARAWGEDSLDVPDERAATLLSGSCEEVCAAANEETYGAGCLVIAPEGVIAWALREDDGWHPEKAYLYLPDAAPRAGDTYVIPRGEQSGDWKARPLALEDLWCVVARGEAQYRWPAELDPPDGCRVLHRPPIPTRLLSLPRLGMEPSGLGYGEGREP